MEVNNNTIKVCFISGAIFRSGGTERVGSIIANALCDRGYKVTILSCWNHGAPYYELDERIHVHYLLNPKTEGKLYRTYIYPILKMHHYIKKNAIDIVIDIDTELARFSAYAKKGTNCKLISWEHFNYWTMLKLGEKKRFRAKKLIKKHASKLVVLTEQDRQKHLEVYHMSDEMVYTIPNPCISNVDADYNFSRHTFLSVGRLAPPKNYRSLLVAWKKIEEQNKDWQLIIVGKGELEEVLKMQSAQLGLERLLFAGHSNHVEEYYKKASCFVLSSSYEGFPMAILEAQSFALPVISYDCKTGPRDLISDGRNGYLVEEDNVEQLAERMLQFTTDREKALHMSEEAIKSVSKFSLEETTQRWCNLINEVYKSS